MTSCCLNFNYAARSILVFYFAENGNFFNGKVTVRGLAVMKADQQLQSLIDAMTKMQGAIAEGAYRSPLYMIDGLVLI